MFGHHHPWDPASDERSETYFGVNPDDSEALCAVIARREAIAGYFAGHTHRTRTRRFASARNVPIVEIACVKDYPGAWAEYRVYEGGYVQLTRRIDAPAALAWTEKTRGMFAGSVSRLRARRRSPTVASRKRSDPHPRAWRSTSTSRISRVVGSGGMLRAASD